jgi:TonB-linked SusC/RagA family outer membrane protein
MNFAVFLPSPFNESHIINRIPTTMSAFILPNAVGRRLGRLASVLLFPLVLNAQSVENQDTVLTLTINSSGNNAASRPALPYGGPHARALTGAATAVQAEQFNPALLIDAHQLWQGLVPGLTAVRAGSDPNEPFDARIRGLHTFLQRTQPLYVVNGVPEVDLAAIDPADIRSVTVLRDAASSAIYGGRSGAGVVLITTLPAATDQPGVRATYRGQVGTSNASGRYDVRSEDDFLRLGGVDESPGATLNTDWQDAILRRATSQAHHLGLQGRLNDGGYWQLGLHARNIEGILLGSGFEQFNGQFSLAQTALRGRLRLSGGLSALGRTQSNGFPQAFRYAVLYNPSAPVKSADPAFAPYGGYFERLYFDYFNPVAIIEQNRNDTRRTYLFGHARAEADLGWGLIGAIVLAREQNRLSTEEFYSKQSRWWGLGLNGHGIQQSVEAGADQLEATLTWQRSFGQHALDLLGGYGWRQRDEQGLSIQTNDLLTDEFGVANLGAYGSTGRGRTEVSSFRREQRLVGMFGRAQWNWNAWFVSAGARRDGASNLGENAKWGLFPFASAGADLAHLLDLRFAQQLKLRIGYGQTGMAPTAAALSKNVFAFHNFSTSLQNGTYRPVYFLAQLANPDLTWERHTEWSGGVDFTLFKNRVSGSIDRFFGRSSDLILDRPVQLAEALVEGQLGDGTMYRNTGALKTQGFELSLNATAVATVDLTWKVGVVASQASTVLEAYWNRPDNYIPPGIAALGAPGNCCGWYQRLELGQEIGTFWAAVTDGTVNDQGTLYLEDYNGDGYVSALDNDRQRITTARPRFEWGLSQQLQWRRFDVRALLRGTVGQHLANDMRLHYEYAFASTSQYNSVVTSYTDEAIRQHVFYNNQHIENASFARLQYAAIGYSLPLAATSGFNELYFHIGAENAFTLTRYTGLDPELRLGDYGPTDNGGRYLYPFKDPLAPGIDRRGSYFPARTWWVGVKAGF